jgi:hypothetical protein
MTKSNPGDKIVYNTFNFVVTYRVDEQDVHIRSKNHNYVSQMYGKEVIEVFGRIYNEYMNAGARETDVNLFHYEDIDAAMRNWIASPTLRDRFKNQLNALNAARRTSDRREGNTAQESTQDSTLSEMEKFHAAIQDTKIEPPVSTGWSTHDKIVKQSEPHALWEITWFYGRAWAKATGNGISIQSRPSREEDIAEANRIDERNKEYIASRLAESPAQKLASLNQIPINDVIQTLWVFLKDEDQKEAADYILSLTHAKSKELNEASSETTGEVESEEQHMIRKLEDENSKLAAALTEEVSKSAALTGRVNNLMGQNQHMIALNGQANNKLQIIALAAESILRATQPPIAERSTQSWAITKSDLKNQGIDSPALTDKY